MIHRYADPTDLVSGDRRTAVSARIERGTLIGSVGAAVVARAA